MSAAVGYSGTPLPRKLGFKPGQKAVFVNLPEELGWLALSEDFGSARRVTTAGELAPPFPLEGGRAGVGGVSERAARRARIGAEPIGAISSGSADTPPPNPPPSRGRARESSAKLDLVHAFFVDAADMTAALPRFRDAIQPAGMIWISWPKRSAGVPTDITENVIRAAALDIGLVDVKVCAVTEVWSGLKLVIPVAQRASR